jgi:predicted RNase H-like nuclease (RuvC/YqgF family)
VNLSRFANDHISEMNRLESCITQVSLALNEVSSRADIIKGRILDANNDSLSVHRLRCELSFQEERMQEDLRGHQNKLEQLIYHLNATLHAHNKEVEQLEYKHQNEIEVIHDKVHVLLEIKKSELEAKRETLFKLKEEYVLKEQELDSLRQNYLTEN